jgi:malate dehydrogenase
MSDVAIFGAGELGGALAHLLARQNIVRAIRLVDGAGRIAAGKALDIAQAAPVEGHATEVEGSNDVMAAAGARVVVIADPAGKADQQAADLPALLKSAIQASPNAVVICAGSSHLELVDRGVGELRIPRARSVGSAPEAMTAAARAVVALAVDGSPRDVALTVLGLPPSHIVVPWEDATIGGFRAVQLIAQPVRRRIAAQVQALWPPGPYTLAAAAVQVIDAVCGGSRRRLTCFVAPDRSAGVRHRTAALPVRLGPDGIEAVLLPELNPADRVALENAMRV